MKCKRKRVAEDDKPDKATPRRSLQEAMDACVKTPEAKNAKQKSMNEDEKTSDERVPARKKTDKRGYENLDDKKTFARRNKPQSEFGATRWLSLRDAFEVHVKPSVTSPSRHEAFQGCHQGLGC